MPLGGRAAARHGHRAVLDHLVAHHGGGAAAGPGTVPALRQPTDANPRTLELLGLDPSLVDPDKLLHGPGCGACSQTGYQGRIGLFEVLTVTGACGSWCRAGAGGSAA